MTRERLTVLARTVLQMKEAFKEGRDWDAYQLEQSIPEDDLEGKLYLGNNLDAHERFVIKEYRKADMEHGLGRSTGEGS